MKNTCWLMAVAFLVGSLMPATARAQSPFDGTWKVDLKTAKFPEKPDVYLLQPRPANPRRRNRDLRWGRIEPDPRSLLRPQRFDPKLFRHGPLRSYQKSPKAHSCVVRYRSMHT